MTISVKRRDLSKYDTFAVSGPNSNHVTIAVRSDHIESCRIDGESRHGIHLLIWGDFGPWEHYWSHAGGAKDTWWSWLHDTDRSYMMGKLCGRETQEFDAVKSLAMAHKSLEETRADLMLEVEGDARAIRDLREDIRDAHDEIRGAEGRSEEAFYQVISGLTYRKEVPIRHTSSTTTRQLPFFEEYYEGMGHHRFKPRLAWFWDHIWRPFIEEANRTEGFTKQAEVAA